MDKNLKIQLQTLAQKYEVFSFTNADPSQFLRWYPLNRTTDVECASFIAAMLAFGNRKQFIPKIKEILTTADATSGSISAWLLSDAPGFPAGEKKFYRFYSYNDMHTLFNELAQIIKQSATLGIFFENIYRTASSQSTNTPLDQIISQSFPNSTIVPKGKNSANKRIHMFLRWMIRQNSPVDLGIWKWANPADLLIPLDVHVMQEGIKLGLLPPNAKATRKTAVELSSKLAEIFPADPARGDFALFGLGVDEEE